MDFQLSDELNLLTNTVSQFAQREIAPRAAKIDQTNQFPRDLWPKLGELGLLGITASPEYGGSGMDYLAHVIAMREISRASGSVGLSYGAHSNLAINQIQLNATPDQQARFLPKLISGEHVGALAMSEANAGSDVMSLQCKAELINDDFVLNGTKMWVTNGPDADILIVYARTGHKSLTSFIIEKTFSGFSTAQKLDKLGMRGSNTCELVFNNCRVPKENVLGDIDQGARVLMSGLDCERVVLAGGPVGLMQACLDIALPYSQDRKQFGKAIGEFQLIQAKLADMYTLYHASQAYLYTIARGSITRKSAASVILYTAENATKMALETIQILGGNGYINDYPAGRLLRDAKLYEIGAGTSEIRRMLIGRELFREGRHAK